MKNRYKMSDLGLLTWYLGMHFSQTSDGIYIDQSQYVASKLTQYGINEWGCAKSLEKEFQLMTAMTATVTLCFRIVWRWVVLYT